MSDSISHHCTICSYCTDRISNLKRHMVSHDRKEQRAQHNKLICDWCTQQFSTFSNCARHMQLYCKQKPIAQEVSQIVPEVSQNVPEVSHNVRQVSPSEFACNMCYKSYTRKSRLDEHSLKCKGVVSSLQCHKCKLILSCKQSKTKHLKRCTAADPITPATNVTNVQTQNNLHVHFHIDANTLQNKKNIGQENVEYLTHDIVERCILDIGSTGFYDLLRMMYFNPEHPENQNVWLGHHHNASDKECYYICNGNVKVGALVEVAILMFREVYKPLCKVSCSQQFRDKHKDETLYLYHRVTKFAPSNMRTREMTNALKVLKTELKSARSHPLSIETTLHK